MSRCWSWRGMHRVTTRRRASSHATFNWRCATTRSWASCWPASPSPMAACCPTSTACCCPRSWPPTTPLSPTRIIHMPLLSRRSCPKRPPRKPPPTPTDAHHIYMIHLRHLHTCVPFHTRLFGTNFYWLWETCHLEWYIDRTCYKKGMHAKNYYVEWWIDRTCYKRYLFECDKNLEQMMDSTRFEYEVKNGCFAYCGVVTAMEFKSSKRELIIWSFSSASLACSLTPCTTAPGAFSTNCKNIQVWWIHDKKIPMAKWCR